MFTFELNWFACFSVNSKFSLVYVKATKCFSVIQVNLFFKHQGPWPFFFSSTPDRPSENVPATQPLRSEPENSVNISSWVIPRDFEAENEHRSFIGKVKEIEKSATEASFEHTESRPLVEIRRPEGFTEMIHWVSA